jgi:hypothetical protein
VAFITIAICSFFTCPIELAGINFTFIYFPVAKSAGISRVTSTCEVSNLVNAPTMLTKIFGTVVFVLFTPGPSESNGTFTDKGVNFIMTNSPVVTWVRITIVEVVFTVSTPEPADAVTMVAVDPICTDPIVPAGSRLAFINIQLTVFSRIS